MNNISISFRFDKAKKATNATQGLLHIQIREVGKADYVLISTGKKSLN